MRRAVRGVRAGPTRERAIVGSLERWFERNQRPLPWRASYDPYQILVSEVMLQQTRMSVVLERFVRFMERFPTVEALAAAPVDEVLAEWSGLGYYRRARSLHAAANHIVAVHGGAMPKDVDKLLRIPGVGRYTAGAIASISFDLPRPLVDGNVLRVLARIERVGLRLDDPALANRVWSDASRFVGIAESPRRWNQSLMELGALICKPAVPECDTCPVENLCAARNAGDERAIPLPKRRAQSVTMHVPLYVIRARDRILVRRGGGSLMHGMWHLPHGSDALAPELRMENVRAVRSLGTFRHTVTFRRIVFEVFEADIDSVADDGESRMMTEEEILSSAHPSYIRKALAIAGKVWKSEER